MPRPSGRRNLDFDAKRTALARRAREAMLKRGTGASLREIAEASETSLTNLRHYFGDRDGLFAAALEVASAEGNPWQELTMRLEGDDAGDVLRRYFELLVVGWRQFGVGRLFEMSIAEGLGSATRGPSTVNHVLEPTLGAVEVLLSRLVERGALPPLEPRAATLSLVSPVLVALLHQDGLFGSGCRELDVPAFVQVHVDAWLKGYGHRG
jgi:AcrR family transcriptional regulator